MRRFHVENFGCRAQNADGEAIAWALEQRGFAPADRRSHADLVIVNSCTVTTAADDDARRAIQRIHRENPLAEILVTGCYAQRAPAELSSMAGVRWVVGNAGKAEIGGMLSETAYHGEIALSGLEETTLCFTSEPGRASRTQARPNVKVQDGCDNRCAFCIIPSVRGRSRSAASDQVVAQIASLSAVHREVVLTGINLGRWGRERSGEGRVLDLLHRILNETSIERVRLSSVEPMDLSDALLEFLAASSRMAKHVHAPLQSGCDRTLRAMKRRYRTRHYQDRIERAFALMPDAAFGADVMTGFPGETNEDFEESRGFIESMPFTYLHVFPYSERPGTPAAERPDSVPVEVRRERAGVLRALAAAKNRAFRTSQLGKTFTAVTLYQRRTAMTSNYLKLALARDAEPNWMIQVTAASLTEDGLAEAGAKSPAVLRVLSTT